MADAFSEFVGTAVATVTARHRCCIMSQNNSFIKQPWNLSFGPRSACPHLVLKGWMYGQRLHVDTGGG